MIESDDEEPQSGDGEDEEDRKEVSGIIELRYGSDIG